MLGVQKRDERKVEVCIKREVGVRKDGRVSVHESWWSSGRLTKAELIRSSRINREQQEQKRLKTEKQAFHFEIKRQWQTEKTQKRWTDRGRWVKNFHFVLCSDVPLWQYFIWHSHLKLNCTYAAVFLSPYKLEFHVSPTFYSFFFSGYSRFIMSQSFSFPFCLSPCY